MMFSFPTDLLNLISQAAAPGTPVFLVGGAVRDHLMGLESRDLDFAVKAGAIQLGRRVADASGGAFYILDADRGTARVLMDRQGIKNTLDFANFRGDNIEVDLNYRDFSINAIALNLNDPQIMIDPLNGQLDISSKTIRACSHSSFRDDPVRILRAVRFLFQLGFALDPATEGDLRKAVSLLANSTIERKRDELFYILGGPKPGAALAVIEKFGILPFLLPELTPLIQLSQSTHHAHDAWEHTLAVLDYCEQILDSFLKDGNNKISNDYLKIAAEELQPLNSSLKSYFYKPINPLRSLRSIYIFAALYHDVGKPITKSEDDEGFHFIDHEIIGAELAGVRARALTLSNEEVQFIECIIRNHMSIHQLVKAQGLDFRMAAYHYFRKTGRAGVLDCLFSLSDLLSTYEERIVASRWEAGTKICFRLLDAWFNHYLEMIKPPLLINGDDLLSRFKLQPGPLIGNLLAKLEESQATGRVGSLEEAQRFIQLVLSDAQSKEDGDSEIIL